MRTPQMHLTMQLVGGTGIEPGAWRRPGVAADGYVNVDAAVRAAKAAERGKFDAVFFADTPAVVDDLSTRSPSWAPLEPVVVLTALARETERIGLVATSSTTFNHAYNVARQFRALDLVSGGRIGWNAVTTGRPQAALNYGAEVPSRGERYAIAEEFIASVMALWGSWPEGALLLDTENGRFADAERIQPVMVRGRHMFSRGPLGLPPSPQGQPVVFQAGGGGNGLALAGLYANGVYNSPFDIPSGAAHWQAVRRAAQAYGRDPDHMTVFNGIVTSVGSTEGEALQRRRELDELGDLESRVQYLGVQIGVPLDMGDLDKPVHKDLLRDAYAHPGDPRAPLALRLAKEGWTVRDVIAHGIIQYHPVAVGAPEQVADMLQHWFESGVGGGFTITPDAADGVEDFVDHVVPILQKRGLFRTEYEGTTLRDHLGIPYQNGLPAAHPA